MMERAVLLHEEQRRSSSEGGQPPPPQHEHEHELQQQLASGHYRLMHNGSRRSIVVSQGSELVDDIAATGCGAWAEPPDTGVPYERSRFTGAELPPTQAFNIAERARLHPPDDSTVFSYPMLRFDEHTVSSTDGVAGDEPPNLYAGTSSGLKISITWIMAGLVVGLALGIVLSDLNVSSSTAIWISLPSDLFLRALKCLIVPYVFCSVAVAVGDIVFAGKVSVIGWRTAKIFFTFWVCTAAMGLAVALAFRPLFRVHQRHDAVSTKSLGLACADNLLVTLTANGTLACSTPSANAVADATAFVVADINHVFTKPATSTAVAKLSLSDQLLSMITPIVSDNIIYSLANSELLSVITFSMVLGSVAGRSYFTKTRETNYLYLILLQLRNTFFLAMEWTIWVSPVAVLSIVSGSFASNHDFLSMFSDVYAYLVADICGGALQILVIYPFIVFCATRTNPYNYMAKMVRAYMFAFACSSSLATMPVTLSCVQKARVCTHSVTNFVISIGVVSNISSMGFYTPIAVVFLAESSGNGDQLTALRLVGLFALSILACAGTPPIPASGLVVISTAYTTLFGSLPSTFAYVAAMDFFCDRISTLCNVNDDLMALKIISETTDETVMQDKPSELV